MKSSVIFCLVLALALSRLGTVAAPLNDSFIYSATLSGNEHFVVSDNTGATAEPGEPNHAGQAGGNSLWWSWTAPTSGHVTLDTAGSFFHPLLAVYTGNAVNSLTLIASNYFAGSFDHPDRSKLSFTAAAGQRYRIAVDKAFDGDGPDVLILYLRAGTLTENDAFANAWDIPPGTLSASGNNVNATREAGEPDHGAGTEGRSIWWRWTAQTNGVVLLDAAGSPSNTVIAVYTGNAVNALSIVAHGVPVFDSAFAFQTTAGTTYRIALDNARDTGPIVLNFRQRPANDTFANAVLLTGADVTAIGENRGSTKQAGEPNHAGISGTKSVWWRWTAPSTGLYVLDAIGSSLGGGLFNPVLAVYTGSSVGSLSPVASENGVDGTASRLRFTATSATTYRIAVGGNSANHGGDIALRLAPAQAAAPNDYFANAIQSPQLPATFSGSNLGATVETPTEVPYDVRATVWWRFVAPITGVATLNKVHGVSTLRMVAYQGTSISSLGVIADNYDSQIFPPRYPCSLGFPVQSGLAYAVSIGAGISDNDVFDQGEFTMNLSVTAAPPNNNFANRIVIPAPGGSATGSNAGANSEVGEPHADELGAFGYDSVWWSYIPAATGPVIVTTAGSSFDTFLGVYTGSSVNGLTRVATNDTAYQWSVIMGPFFDRISRVKFNGVAGQAYRIAVTTARGGPGDVVVNLPTVAIEDIVSMTNILQPDRSMLFTNNLRLTNLRTSQTGPLRFRLIARAGYSHVDMLLDNCGGNMPAMNLADQEIGIVDFPSPGYLAAQTSITLPVSGVCPPPYEAGKWGNGWGAIAILEELTEPGWEVRDSRLLVFGNWPRVGGFIGPGGGVITVASGTGPVLPSPGFIDVSIGPLAAVRLGGQWRVSPTNFGSLSLFTNFTGQSLILPVRTNNFSIDVRDLAGFNPPTNRAFTIRSGFHTPLNLLYSVHPPRLFYNPSGLSITGTPGTAYRIDRCDTLRPPITWSSNAGRTLSAGQNSIPNTAPVPATNHYYRAFWLSD
jgi:hypothetical protein